MSKRRRVADQVGLRPRLMKLTQEDRCDRRAPIAALARGSRGVQRRMQDAIAQVSRRVGDGAVALTFDDGPHPGSTDRVLDTLAELDVKATFFCVGKNARANPDLVRRIRSDGHSIGSHSLAHPHPRVTSLAALAEQYYRGRQAVTEILGVDVPLFRPPHGHLNLASAVMVRRQGLRTWLWTIDPGDFLPGVTADHITSKAGRALSGDVVVLHDWVEQPMAPEALDRSATVRALPSIVADIRARGLTFARLQP